MTIIILILAAPYITWLWLWLTRDRTCTIKLADYEAVDFGGLPRIIAPPHPDIIPIFGVTHMEVPINDEGDQAWVEIHHPLTRRPYSQLWNDECDRAINDVSELFEQLPDIDDLDID